jgi:hypothetical protein
VGFLRFWSGCAWRLVAMHRVTKLQCNLKSVGIVTCAGRYCSRRLLPLPPP